jgi:twitching motility protein PilT
MRRPELDQVLTTILASQPEVSDVIFTVDRPPQVEAYGELKPVVLDPPIEKLTPFQVETVALNMIGDNAWQIEDLIKHGSCDGSYALGESARFRVNVFSQRGNYSIVCRQLNAKIPTLEQLRLPEALNEIPKEKTGLVLVTGATGSGKSTTLAAILNRINQTKPSMWLRWKTRSNTCTNTTRPHSTSASWELISTPTSTACGRHCARHPRSFLWGEMRDRDTVKIALSAAETGHLVLSTLHTINAGETINRILGMFEPEEQEQVRIRLADSLRWVVSQRLAPKVGRRPTRPRSKSWAQICAPRRQFAWVKAKAKPFTKSSRPVIPLAGAPLTKPAWRPLRRAQSPRKPHCSIAPNAVWCPGAWIIQGNRAEKWIPAPDCSA